MERRTTKVAQTYQTRTIIKGLFKNRFYVRINLNFFEIFCLLSKSLVLVNDRLNSILTPWGTLKAGRSKNNCFSRNLNCHCQTR